MSNLENLYTLARRGWQSKDYRQSKKYYEEIRDVATDSWEATFYYYLSCVRLATLEKDFMNAYFLFNSCINSVFDILENEKDFDEQLNHIKSTNDELETAINETHFAHIKFMEREVNRSNGSDALSYQIPRERKLEIERKSIIEECLKERQKRLDDIVGKKRLEFFWANNQSLKEELENEKRTLENDIKTLEKDITEIPSRDVEYNRLTELSNLLENQKAEKKSLGLFGWLLKSKVNNEIKQKIKDTKNQIQPIQARIDAAILEANGKIDEKKKRIVEIDQEFVKPR